MGIFNTCLYDSYYNEAKNGSYAEYKKRIFFLMPLGLIHFKQLLVLYFHGAFYKMEWKNQLRLVAVEQKQQAQKQSNIAEHYTGCQYCLTMLRPDGE